MHYGVRRHRSLTRLWQCGVLVLLGSFKLVD